MNKTKAIFDPWLSSLIGKNCYSFLKSKNIDTGFKLKPDCFYQTKLNVQNIYDISDFMASGFKIITHDVTLCLNKLNLQSNFSIGENFQIIQAKPECTPKNGLLKIAENSFKYDRFHQDRNISKNVANNIKKQWLQNFFNGVRGDHLFIAVDKEKIGGFLLIIIKKNVAIIDLIAVNSKSRGQKLSHKLIFHALKRLPNNVTSIVVGTQLKNISSLRLYRSLGFEVVANTVNLHLHT